MLHLPRNGESKKGYGLVVAYYPMGAELTTPEMLVTVTIQVVRARPMAPVNRMAGRRNQDRKEPGDGDGWSDPVIQ